MTHLVEGGRVMLFVSLWCIAYENWSVTHPLVIVCTPFSAGELNLLPNFQKGGGLTGLQFLEGLAGKERGDFSQEGRGGGHFLHKKWTKIWNI